jgi:hypothetical protein
MDNAKNDAVPLEYFGWGQSMDLPMPFLASHESGVDMLKVRALEEILKASGWNRANPAIVVKNDEQEVL